MASYRCIRPFFAPIPAVTLLATSCAPAPSPVAGAPTAATPAQSQPFDRYADLREAIARSEAIVTAQVRDTDFSAPAADGFLSTLHVQVTQILRGRATVGRRLCIRVPVGQDRNGQWHITAHTHLISDNPKSRVEPGQDLLLFISRSYYEVQAKARGGMALPECTAAPFGMARLQAGIISTDHLAYDAPEALDDLKRLLEQIP